MPNLKLMTLNLHCFAEDNILDKQKTIAETILEKDIGIIFFQEVCQPMDANPTVFCMKEGNYAATIQQLVGEKYQLYCLPIKRGFGIYDEGVAILSKYNLTVHSTPYISKNNDYDNWKSRRILVCKGHIEGVDVAVATTHFGWSDGIELFEDQATIATHAFPNLERKILAGDFNIAPFSKEYNHITSLKWIDTQAGKTTPTFHNPMDIHTGTSRIDYVFTSMPVEVVEEEMLFIENRVSDHFGIFLHINFN